MFCSSELSFPREEGGDWDESMADVNSCLAYYSVNSVGVAHSTIVFGRVGRATVVATTIGAH